MWSIQLVQVCESIKYNISTGEGENAYSYGFETYLNAFTSDKYTFLFVKYLNSTFHEIFSQTSLKKFFEYFNKVFLDSSPVYTNNVMKRYEYKDCQNLLSYKNNSTEVEYDKYQDSVYASDIPIIAFFPPPFAITDHGDKATKYSIYEREKHLVSQKALKEATNFFNKIENIKTYKLCLILICMILMFEFQDKIQKLMNLWYNWKNNGIINEIASSTMPKRASSNRPSDSELGNYIDLLRNSLKADSMDTSLISMFASLFCSFGGSNSVALPPIDYHKEFEEIEKSLKDSG